MEIQDCGNTHLPARASSKQPSRTVWKLADLNLCRINFSLQPCLGVNARPLRRVRFVAIPRHGGGLYCGPLSTFVDKEKYREHCGAVSPQFSISAQYSSYTLRMQTNAYMQCTFHEQTAGHEHETNEEQLTEDCKKYNSTRHNSRDCSWRQSSRRPTICSPNVSAIQTALHHGLATPIEKGLRQWMCTLNTRGQPQRPGRRMRVKAMIEGQ